MKQLLVLIAVILLLTAAALAEPEEMAAAFAAEYLPEYTYIDGVQFDETAMLLVEEADGRVFFAGCVRDGEEWAITLSTPLPDWAGGGLDTFHAGEGGIRVWLDLPEAYRAYEDMDSIFAVVSLQKDGTWRINVVNTGWGVIEFRRKSIYDDCGYEFFGDMSIPLDITQVDWSLLPRSFHQAMDLLDTSRWMTVAVPYAPVYAEANPNSSIAGRAAAGAPVQMLAAADDMVQVQFIGREDAGWMLEGDLLPGSAQAACYDAWYDDPDAFLLDQIILEADDPVTSWYAAAHAADTASDFHVDHVEYVSVLGWCTENCCCLLYSETLGTSGFVPVDQLPYLPE